ncbi:CHAT domain-containing protein [Pedococcus sp. KACC 23699]|uniref:CHAT domain-containing protein n=1 Tax=Pedococcus sp. KACC 23699 TaxID=3149228 RepID=A0AAU7JZ29_9MICO
MAWTTVALRGRGEALDLLREVRELTDSPRLHALSRVQEAVVHVSLSDWREALTALAHVDDTSMALLTPRERTAALLNGGLSHLSLLELDQARAQLQEALDTAVAERVPEQEFKARHNLGCLEFYAGNLPGAISLMRSADEVDAPVARARAKQDLAQVLLESGLLRQARQTLLGALDEARDEQLALEEADIRLDLAACSLVEGDFAAARRELGAAIRIYRTRGADGRQRSTSLLRAAVDLGDGRVPRGIDTLLVPWLGTGRPVTSEERLAVRIHAETLLLRGDVAGAAYAAKPLRGAAHQGLAAAMHDRLLFAKVAAAQGDSRGARREVHASARQLGRRQAPTQSLEVRAALALHGRRLSEFDLGDALASGSARRIFDSVERWRAISHRLPPVRAPLDPDTSALMAQLRQTRLQLGSTAAGEDEVTLRSRVASLEGRIAERDWSTSAPTVGNPADHPDERTGRHDVGHVAGHRGGAGAAAAFTRTRAVLGARDEVALVLFAHAGEQYSLEVGAQRRSRVRHLGSVTAVTVLADRLVRDLRAHAFASVNPALAAAVGRAVDASLAELDRAVLGDLSLPRGSGVVVAPSRALASVPWTALPRLAGRPVTVAASLTRWATPQPPAGGPTTVASLAGPGLRRAVDEAGDIAAAWGARSASTPNGTDDSRALIGALAGDTVVHVAAHGTHEPQNPFFSSLHLADGPVFAHELPRPLRSRHVVLSACDVGQSDLRPGDEPFGLTAALLSLGARSVVAAVAPVADEVAALAMVDYHRQLSVGVPAARALATAVTEHPGARSFCLFGADWATPPTSV